MEILEPTVEKVTFEISSKAQERYLRAVSGGYVKGASISKKTADKILKETPKGKAYKKLPDKVKHHK